MIVFSNHISGLSLNLSGFRCESFVNLLASQGVNVNETSQLINVAATTTIENFVRQYIKDEFTVIDASDGVNLLAEVYSKEKRIASVYKSFDENFKPILLIRFPLEF